MKSLLIDGVKLNFIESNLDKKKTIIFLHGNSHSLKTFKEQMNAEQLKDYRLISIDLPGHGDSSKDGKYSLKNFAQLINNFILELGISEVVIVGHSMGGHVAINLLKFYNPKGLLVFGTPPLKNPFEPIGFLPNENVKALGLTTEATISDVETLMSEMNYKNDFLKLAVADYLRTDPRFRQEIFTDIVSGNHENEIYLINSFYGKLMFLLATKDSMINNEYILNEFKNSKNEIIEIETGHSPHIESSENFNNILSDFCQRVFKEELERPLNLNNVLQHESSYEQRN